MTRSRIVESVDNTNVEQTNRNDVKVFSLYQREQIQEERGKCQRRRTIRKEKLIVPGPGVGNKEGETERKRERCTEPQPRCRLTTGSVRLPMREPSLHAISTTILPQFAPFVLRSMERPLSSLSFEMHRCVRSLHNYYDYREQQLARC